MLDGLVLAWGRGPLARAPDALNELMDPHPKLADDSLTMIICCLIGCVIVCACEDKYSGEAVSPSARTSSIMVLLPERHDLTLAGTRRFHQKQRHTRRLRDQG